jgi:hypothetical protein
MRRARRDTSTRMGKSLLLSGNRVKPQSKKYFALSEVRSGLYPSPSRPAQRGVSWSSRTWDGERWTRKLRLTSAVDAYGKGVWS